LVAVSFLPHITSKGILAANPELVKRLRPHPPRRGSVVYARHNTRALRTEITPLRAFLWETIKGLAERLASCSDSELRVLV
jgi:hypothetical protein